ncbi:MAG: hypothetical protein EZS28_000947 [Streblomastix strix]|uniref:RPAP1 C-terminal domain-containing protein n=1 Tax=Streblomastix strix TaxID=222440 RepID=A0A5J4XAJ5_9EUKA|nr:MAG: hypothetical protein EZS28_000947 [Streblomastix strix]
MLPNKPFAPIKDIVEHEIESDDEDEKPEDPPFLKFGFPPVTHRSDPNNPLKGSKSLDVSTLEKKQIKKKLAVEPVSEEAKLEWTKPMKPVKKVSQSSLRFDFDGLPIDPSTSDDIPVQSGLFHHGDEENIAGYCIDELLRLVGEICQQWWK